MNWREKGEDFRSCVDDDNISISKSLKTHSRYVNRRTFLSFTVLYCGIYTFSVWKLISSRLSPCERAENRCRSEIPSSPTSINFSRCGFYTTFQTFILLAEKMFFFALCHTEKLKFLLITMARSTFLHNFLDILQSETTQFPMRAIKVSNSKTFLVFLIFITLATHKKKLFPLVY